MQLTAGTVNALQYTKSNFQSAAQQGSQKAPAIVEVDAWLVFDTETEQSFQVEQSQLVKTPFLGPLETMLLAGLVVAALARHFVRGAHASK